MFCRYVGRGSGADDGGHSRIKAQLLRADETYWKHPDDATACETIKQVFAGLAKPPSVFDPYGVA
jgi:hypothetical protein